MTRILPKFTVSIMVLAAGLLASAVQAQTQPGANPQNGIWQTGSVNPSRSESAPVAPAATPASAKDSDASSWSAGGGSFGTQHAMPKAVNSSSAKMGNGIAPPSGSSSWTAGRGSFGSTAQTGGVWGNKTGLARAPGSGTTRRPANGLYLPYAPRNFTGTPSSHAVAPRSSTGTHISSGSHATTLSGVSKNSGGSALGRTAAKNSHSQTSQQGRGRTSIGAGTKPSRFESTTQAPGSSESTSSGSRDGSSGENGAAQAPQQ